MTTTESNNQDNNKPKLGNAEFDYPEQKEIDDAVLFGLEKMHNLYFVEEPKLYKMGKFLRFKTAIQRNMFSMSQNAFAF